MLLEKSATMQKVPGIDGQKMSKSYGNDIWIFEEGKALKKRVGKIVTDSRPPEEPKDSSELFLFDLLALFLDADELADWKSQVEKGGDSAPGYGHLKMRLKDAVEEHFAEAREKRLELLATPSVVDEILAAGAAKARTRAQEVRDRALHACGLR